MNGLPAIAQHLASQGRNGDSVLVHMTPGEVRGLQALAEQHGTSLTINPDTGLPEAFSLRSLLPMIAGIALTPIMGPMGAAMAVGGVETARTGDIGKGLMAGLGAYGGANLGAGLGAAGAQPAQQAAMANAATQQAANQQILAGLGSDTGVMSVGALPGSDAGVAQIMDAYTQNVPQSLTQKYAAMGQGFKGLGSDVGRSAFMSNIGGYGGLAKSGGMAAAPMIAEAMTPKPYKLPEEEDPYANYEGPYTPSVRQVSYPDEDFRRRRTSEFTYFTPSNPVPFQEGGDVGMNVTPAEAEVYRNIANVQRMAGIPSIANMPMMVSPQRDVSSLVYNPIEYSPSDMPTGEQSYGFQPLMSEKEAKKAVAESLRKDDGSGIFGGLFGGLSGGLSGGDSSDQRLLLSMGYKNGGVPMLEDGGFVLTKKAVDGLGKGDNKRGQKVASRGLGAVPIKGPGTGTSDSIRTTIEGKQPALVSNGEAYVPKRQVEKKGGAKKFYALMKAAERRA